MAKEGNALLVLIIGAGLIFALVMPSLLTSGMGLLDKLGDFVRDGFHMPDSASNGYANLGFTIQYKDGTTKEVSPDSFFPFSIQLDGKEIASVKADLYVKLEALGDINQWSITGSLTLDVRVMATAQTKHYLTDNLSDSGATWTSGATLKVHTHQWQASVLESWLNTQMPLPEDRAESVIYVYYSIDLTVNVTFADASTDTKSASLDNAGIFGGLWTPSEIASLSVEIVTTPL